ncbi:hypothetical protein ACP179_01400 (plasmid) [Xenorhabdus stockiae]|uniref:hypothetical protein n=1 Tax=Xenorhabdus stockiae TaxID=351614 RepID=UPI003CEB21C1
MSEPYIRINQFFANSSGPGQKSVLGHANYSFFDANGVYKGTYGSNLKSDDGRPSGVRRKMKIMLEEYKWAPLMLKSASNSHRWILITL